MVLKGDLTVSTESVERLSVLEGEKEGSGSIPARQTAGKTIGGRVLLRLNAKVWGEKLVYLWPDEYFAGFTFTFLFKAKYILSTCGFR